MPADIIPPKPPAVIPRATHGSPDHPLKIQGLEIPCYVLEDGTRVITLTGLLRSLDMSGGGYGRYSRESGDRLARFAATNSINPFISNDLITRIQTPIKFRTSRSTAKGYEATILVDLCDAILAARLAGGLTPRQTHIAERAEILVRGFAKIGIIALVDECTGYQENRDRDALHKLLAKYMTEERVAWAKLFPDDYWKHLFRLRGLSWPAVGYKTPRYIGHLVNKTVYDRLPPGVLEELKRRNPPSEETGRRKYRHHQFLSEDLGQPDLRYHLLQLMPIMRISPDWETFEKHFATAFPAPGTPAEVLEIMELEAKRKAKKGAA
jgi:hypothetical protein